MSNALADDVRQTAADAYGTVPNLFEETNSYTGIPGAVYVAADAALMDGNLRPPEQQAVLLTMARYHNSRYDAVVHARMGLDAGLSPAAIERLLAGEPVPDDRLQALVDATLRSCEERGWLDPETLRDLKKRGVGRGELYEIFAFIGLKTMTGFTAHLSDPELDRPLESVEDALNNVPDEPDTIERERLFMG
jgi:alkylhydroperoxidase family enzyme